MMSVFLKQRSIGIGLVFLLLLAGCSSNQATYFRKHDATVYDERLAWGLCGGNFFPDGSLRPDPSAELIKCMADEGFETINAYYRETLVAWRKRDAPNDVMWNYDELKSCGARYTTRGICKHSLFILNSEFNRINQCMSSKGYVASIARYKIGVRLFDKLQDVDPNYCTYLTPINERGGVSLGNSRVDF